MKKAKRTLAFILALAMCFTLVSSFAFAEEKEHLKYLSLGDSTTLGYFTPGFIDMPSQAGNLQPTYLEGGEEYSNTGYPYQMYNYLKEYAEANGMVMDRDDFYQYAVCGMRPNELYAILDPEGAAATMDKFCEERVGWYTWDTAQGGFGTGSIEGLNEIFTEAIKEADVITYDLGMNCFGNYLIDRLMALLGTDYSKFEKDTFELMYNQMDNEATKLACKTLESTLKNMIGGVLKDNPEMADKLLDFALYCFSSFCVYFDKSVDEIYNIKNGEDFDLIVVSQYNGMKDLKFVIGEGEAATTIDFGKIMGTVFSAMNTHITTFNKHANQYKYADCGDVTTFTDELKSGEIRDTTKDVFATARDGLEFLFAGADDKTYENISKLANSSDVLLAPVVEALSAAPDEMFDKMIVPCMNVIADFDNASPEDISVAYIIVICKAARGFASHPNVDGCADKFEAVKIAFEGDKTASFYAAKTVTNIVSSGIQAAWTSIKAPVLEAIKTAITDFTNQFFDYFKNIADSMYDTFKAMIGI